MSPDRRPRRLLRWKEAADGNIDVLRPKFGPGRLGRWLSRRLTHSHLAIRLDPTGSFVWRRCDGQHTVADIVEALRKRDGANRTDLDARLATFLDRMARRRMIAL